MALLNYHHSTMESRRTIELQIFIAAITLFLIITKGLYDARDVVALVSWAPAAIAVAYGFLLAIYFWMLFRIETANMFDRQQYHRLEKCARRMLPGLTEIVETKGTKNESKKETVGQAISRSWAAVPPFAVAVVIAVSCWGFLFLAPSGTPKREHLTPSSATVSTTLPAKAQPKGNK